MGRYTLALIALFTLLIAPHGVAQNTGDGDELLHAAGRGNLSGVLASLENGIDVDYDNGFGTALYLAATGGHEDVVKALLAAGANVAYRGNGGVTPLLWAADYGRDGVVTALLASGADINQEDDSGWTALIHASSSGRTTVVKILLAAGADVDHMAKNDLTALLIVVSRRGIGGRYEEIEQALVKAGAGSADSAMKVEELRNRRRAELNRRRALRRPSSWTLSVKGRLVKLERGMSKREVEAALGTSMSIAARFPDCPIIIKGGGATYSFDESCLLRDVD